MASPDPDLVRLAEAYRIATDYYDWKGAQVQVAAATLVAVLAAMGVDATGPEQIRQALDELPLRPWRSMLPASLTLVRGRSTTVAVHADAGAEVRVWIEREDGGRTADLPRGDEAPQTRLIDDRSLTRLEFTVPDDLPLGYHTLHAEAGERRAAAPLIVTPDRLGWPGGLETRPGWGIASQLYSVRSAGSWGVGDLTDLTDLAAWSGLDHGADFVLINPVHAAEPVPPLEPSPYLPASRRFTNPIYLRPEAIAEYATLRRKDRKIIRKLRERVLHTPGIGYRIDRNASWAAKRAALKLIFEAGRTPGRQLAFGGYLDREGADLIDFATWSVLAEQYGPDARRWPEPFRDPRSAEIRQFVDDHAADLEFTCWLQWQCDEQLARVQDDARRFGLRFGVIHDLAVGVHPGGADAWRLRDSYATGISVGAPPDAYNQLGQDWNQPPWRPDRLAATGFRPFREMVASLLRHAGGVRVDHVIGLYRLWWIPSGGGPKEGTYVRYDHEALVGILALEAERAGAVVIGEDLGTVEPLARDVLRERGILGTSILWFERDWAADIPLPAERWRQACLASVTTHDLPPTAAYLRGDHVRLRDRLGLLERSVAEELGDARAERESWLAELRGRGLLRADQERVGEEGEEAVIAALHRFLGQTPAVLRAVALPDLVGDRRVQNQPGTMDEHPNWRMPLSHPDGRPMVLEEVLTSRRAATLAKVMADGAGRSS
ncbi:4-alpha-glucanotransferase [Microlunatus speluncae]|uniref:4-alpha-glucanotransferase n=1 Tax=Microlunatus speluncae TaxID=2594267 RepID=UPI001FE73FA0|nr:4-alpha-glucanotransferase [Microlunatus speluncae]